MSRPGPTYAEVVAAVPCPRCGAPTGTRCHDLATTSDTRHLITPHRDRQRAARGATP